MPCRISGSVSEQTFAGLIWTYVPAQETAYVFSVQPKTENK